MPRSLGFLLWQLRAVSAVIAAVGRDRVAPYQISYFAQDGSMVHREQIRFRDDDHAIDWVGASDHPHEIHIHQGERLVAKVPPVHRSSPF